MGAEVPVKYCACGEPLYNHRAKLCPQCRRIKQRESQLEYKKDGGKNVVKQKVRKCSCGAILEYRRQFCSECGAQRQKERLRRKRLRNNPKLRRKNSRRKDDSNDRQLHLMNALIRLDWDLQSVAEENGLSVQQLKEEMIERNIPVVRPPVPDGMGNRAVDYGATYKLGWKP